MTRKHQILKASLLSLLMLGGETGTLAADSIEHTFNHGSAIEYSFGEKAVEASATPAIPTELRLKLPFFGEMTLKGKGELSKKENNDYTLKLNPQIDLSAYLENTSGNLLWNKFFANKEGAIVLQVNEEGESIEAKNFTIDQDLSQLQAEALEYSHTMKKLEGSEELYSNKGKFLLTNGKHIPKTESDLDEDQLLALLKNPFSKFKEVLIDFSYVSGKEFDDYRKDLNGKYHAKGHNNFILDGSITSGFPFEKIPEAKDLPGFTFTLSVPSIDIRVEGEEEKKGVLETLKHNYKYYIKLLEEHQNSITTPLLESLKKNEKEVTDRFYKFFTEFKKEDIFSLFFTFKQAKPEDPNAIIPMFVEGNLIVRDFNIKAFAASTEKSPSIVISMENPELSIQDFVKHIQEDAWLLEPVLKDLGTWDIIQNIANPERILHLLRELSDNPKASAKDPLVITVRLNENQTTIGTLTEDKATQLMMGWFLTVVPIKK